MPSSSLIKSILHRSLAEGVYRDIVTRNSSYYYFLGKTLKWNVDDTPPYPIDSYAYERAVRDEIITLKEIKYTDAGFVVPKISWQSGEVYDMYDDEYGKEVIGLNIISGGDGYTTLPTFAITGGGGTGASYTAVVDTGTGRVIGADLVSRGSGYTSTPVVTVSGGGATTNAVVQAVVNVAPSGAHALEDALFYVMTDEFNVYKCLDNYNNSSSTIKPTGTQVDPFTLLDGYLWKFLYNVPIGLRNKFMTTDQIPVISALTNQFYSNGTIDTVTVDTKGSNYVSANITVESGDGYLQADPLYINSITVLAGGSSYTTPTVTFSNPITNSSSFTSLGQGTSVYLGQKVSNTNYDFYEVVTPGNLGGQEPTHTYGIVKNDGYIGTAWTASTVLALYAQVYVGNRLYTVTARTGDFTTDTTAPSHTSGTVSNNNVSLLYAGVTPSGTAVLKYLGSTIKATATVSSGAVTAINMIGSVREANINVAGGTSGSGYTNIPVVSFSGGGGTGAAGIAKMNGSSVAYIVITARGSNYTSVPTVTLGTLWTSSTTLTINDQVYYGDNLYTVTTGGSSGTVAPIHSSAAVTATGGTAVLTYAGKRAKAIATLGYGAGYSSNPTITLSSPGTGFQYSILSGKSNAKLLPIIENSQVTGVIVEDAGVGYTTASLVVNSGTGSGAKLSINLSVGNIQSLQANNEILTVAGAIDAIKVISGGYNYGAAYVSIIGDGTGATASTVIDPITGAITKINITSRGYGYTFANITIYGNGVGATARAIMPPYGGHGKNCPDELFSRTLMFYTNVSTDLNQGLSVNNDYRQLGIIKNPRYYNSTNRYNQTLGSACFLIECDFTSGNFIADMDVHLSRGILWSASATVTLGQQIYYGDNLYTVSLAGTTSSTQPTHTSASAYSGTAVLNWVGSPRRKYRIVSINSSSAILQSLDNDTPTISDTLLNDLNQGFTPKTVGYPTIDKYSGQLMYIDNKAGFSPSADQTVTLRTVIKF